MITELIEILIHAPKYPKLTGEELQVPMHLWFHMINGNYGTPSDPVFTVEDLKTIE